jgi:hypothetical protein
MINDVRSLFSAGKFWMTLLTGAGLLIILSGVLYAMGYATYAIVLVSVVAMLAGAITGVKAFFNRRNKKASEQVEHDLTENARSRPAGYTDAESVRAHESARDKFEKGLETIRSRGRGIGELPWYLIVGEPASGKSEAIRRGGLTFPPGMQDEYQGVGGTINMDWWFTDDGCVLIDTAGKLLFERAERTQSKEWTDLLGRIAKARKHRPISGILLFLPADSLMTDEPHVAEEKASRIGGQLQLIQSKVGVRCPVYVVVSKSDLIGGFREFFDEIDDPRLEQQILGWSNQRPLDEHFDPREIDQHLRELADKIRRYRFALLANPTPRFSERRIDEVDALYDFPNELEKLADRLELYLARVFGGGYWSEPLFCRGLYFTSALREGEAIDAILAESMGKQLDDIPGDARQWDEKRSLFIRDLMLEKVLPEQNLVTRSGRADKSYRRRKALVLGFGGAAFLLFCGLTALGYFNFRGSADAPREAWKTLKSGYLSEEQSGTALIAENGTYRGEETVNLRLATDGDGTRVADFTETLFDIDGVGEPIRVPFLFGWTGRGVSEERRYETLALLHFRAQEAEAFDGARAWFRQQYTAKSPVFDMQAMRTLRELVKLEVDAELGGEAVRQQEHDRIGVAEMVRLVASDLPDTFSEGTLHDGTREVWAAFNDQRNNPVIGLRRADADRSVAAIEQATAWLGHSRLFEDWQLRLEGSAKDLEAVVQMFIDARERERSLVTMGFSPTSAQAYAEARDAFGSRLGELNEEVERARAAYKELTDRLTIDQRRFDEWEEELRTRWIDDVIGEIEREIARLSAQQDDSDQPIPQHLAELREAVSQAGEIIAQRIESRFNALQARLDGIASGYIDGGAVGERLDLYAEIKKQLNRDEIAADPRALLAAHKGGGVLTRIAGDLRTLEERVADVELGDIQIGRAHV